MRKTEKQWKRFYLLISIFSRSKNFRDNEKVTQNLFNPKTINARYVQNVTKSDLFLKDFNIYLDKDFIADYSKSREFKIGKV